MDIEYLGRVLARLQPFVSSHVIRRSRIERVLSTLRTPPEGLATEIDRLLTKAGIVIDDDVAPELMQHDPADGLGIDVESAIARDGLFATVPGTDLLFVSAARRRIEADRCVSNHAKVLLRPEEEVGLALLIRGDAGKPLHQGDFARLTGEAREAAVCLLLHNQGLVHSVAKRYAPSGMTYEDLFQHGITGLIRAVELFDPNLGYKFSTYAMNWVRQAITRAIANESRMIRLPVHMYERVMKVWHTRARLTVDGEEPSVHQLALACELTDDQVMECLMLGPQDILSLDTPVGPEGETTLGDLYESVDPYSDPVHEMEFVLLQEQLHAVLDTLSEREAGVISMRHGLTDGAPKTLDEIGKVYGVTRERIRQIESKTMDKLRHPSRSNVLRVYMYGPEDDRPKRMRPVSTEDEAEAEQATN